MATFERGNVTVPCDVPTHKPIIKYVYINKGRSGARAGEVMRV